jgi:hypothetical protein
MQRHCIAFFVLISCTSIAQQRRIPVSVSRTGEDQVGAVFVAALNREISHSTKYVLMPGEGATAGLRFYLELATIDVAEDSQGLGKRSAVSVVAQDMGLPNTFPVSSIWYHKVIVVNRQTTDKFAKELVEDLDARWCKTIKSSVDGCPKEKLSPSP